MPISSPFNGVPLIAKMDDVSEILPPPETIRVPGVIQWVKGIANIRGNLMPILDMNGFLYGKETEFNKQTRILIINKLGVVAGLLVDEVYGLRRFKPDELRDEIATQEVWRRQKRSRHRKQLDQSYPTSRRTHLEGQ